MNRFAHLKQGGDEIPEALAGSEGTIPSDTPAQPTPPLPALPTSIEGLEPVLAEVGHLVERRVGILGKVPASLKDAYDEMLLRARKYIGRPNADLAVQAWVELTLEDEAFRNRWLKRMQDLRKK